MADVIRAVLFDLDGTMVDNMQYHIDAWIEMGQKLGHELTRERIQREFSGRKNEELFPALLGRPLASSEIERLSEEKEARYRELFAPHVKLLDGLEAFVELLLARGTAVGIATAAPAKNRDLVLDRSGLGARISVVVGAEQVKRGKPAPDLFLAAAQKLGCEPSSTLVFEDALLGVQAGRAAGMRVCGVTTSEAPEALLVAGAHFTIRNFTELPELATAAELIFEADKQSVLKG
ncbi:MAG TPA: beta-phosphoglucomutase family hydrolase [Polyangiaceae bacterium]|jgi:beta-phosphoglucomutase family hydrolase|nr:beta-phosphoglucomutase family hydrolase [Polyangiaceae bacterium]